MEKYQVVITEEGRQDLIALSHAIKCEYKAPDTATGI